MAAASGNHWCAYPDPSCPSGYRYSDFQVGDGLSGVCVISMIDAGVPPDTLLVCRRRVAFSDGAQDHGDIWVANPDGSGLVNVSDNTAEDANPSWSPDGLRLAFQSNREGNFDIFSVNYDGSGLVNLTKGNATGDYLPVWSPDGTRIAFVRASSTPPFNSTVWVMNANGTGATQISNLTFSSDLAWSPTGNKVVFGFYDANIPPHAKVPLLYVAGVGTGTSPIKLTAQIDIGEQRASWAPGSKIAFDNASDVITADESGANLLNITQSVGHNFAPHFTHNGGKIAFTSDRDNGHQEVWLVDANGANAAQVTHNTALNGADFVTDISSDDVLVAYTHATSPTKTEAAVSSVDGVTNNTFNAPGGNNARGVKFSACP
jgi:Tol biopolymer transport system component